MQKVRHALLLGVILLGAARVEAGEGVVPPAYYPDDYAQIIEASKDEDGLLIYGNIAEYNWRYIIQGFKEKYPWVENVQSLDLGPSRRVSPLEVQRRTDALYLTGATVFTRVEL